MSTDKQDEKPETIQTDAESQEYGAQHGQTAQGKESGSSAREGGEGARGGSEPSETGEGTGARAGEYS